MKVFISYSHEDRPTVERLAQDLRIYGFDVWIDFWSMRAGDSLLTKIGQGITEAAFFCVALSRTSVASDWVNRELEVALQREFAEKRVIVIPLRLEVVTMPPFLTTKVYADLSRSYEEGLKQTLEALQPGYDVLHLDAPEFHVDYAVDFEVEGDVPSWRIILVDHGPSDYVVLCTIAVSGHSHLKRRLETYQSGGFAPVLTPVLLDLLATAAETKDPLLSLNGVAPLELGYRMGAKGEDGVEEVRVELRRLGGRHDEDIVVHFGRILRMLAEHHRTVTMTAIGPAGRDRYRAHLISKGLLPPQ